MLSHFSCVQLFATPWTVARQALLSMALSRQEYWSGLPCPPPGDLPDPGIEPMTPVAPASFTSELPGEACAQALNPDQIPECFLSLPKYAWMLPPSAASLICIAIIFIPTSLYSGVKGA